MKKKSMEIECVTSKWHFGTNGGNGRTLNPAFGGGRGGEREARGAFLTFQPGPPIDRK